MAKAIGRLINVGIAREATRGTAVAAQYWLPKTDFSFSDKIDKVVSAESLGVIEDADQAHITSKYAEGDIGGEIRDQSIGVLLYGLLGTCSSAANGAAYDHTFTTQNDNSCDSLSISVDDPAAGADLMFRRAMLSQMTFNMNVGEVGTWTAGFMSHQAEDWQAFTASYTNENRFTPCNASIKIAASQGDLAAASTFNIKSASLTVTKNLMMDNVLGTCEPEDIHNQQLTVEGTMTLNLENETYKDLMLNNTYRAMRLAFVNTGVDLGGGVNPKVQIDLSRCHFFDWTPDRPNDEIATQTLSFKALYDLANTDNAIYNIILTNSVASYS